MTTTKIWECKIGEVDSVAGGSDYPMREAVAAAYKAITGVEPVFIFSGWGASLTEYERAVVEYRLPAPAAAPSAKAKKPRLNSAAFMTALAAAAESRKMSMRDVSMATGVNETTLSRMKRGERACDAASFSALATWAGLNPQDFYLPSTAPATTPEQPSWQDAPTKPGMWACLYMGELSTAIFNAYEIEHFDASEMGGCRWKFIPEDKQ